MRKKSSSRWIKFFYFFSCLSFSLQVNLFVHDFQYILPLSVCLIVFFTICIILCISLSLFVNYLALWTVCLVILATKCVSLDVLSVSKVSACFHLIQLLSKICSYNSLSIIHILNPWRFMALQWTNHFGSGFFVIKYT